MDYLQAILVHEISTILMVARKASEQMSNLAGCSAGTTILLGNDAAKELV